MEEACDPEGLIDMNTNANGKVSRVTARPGKGRRKGGGKEEGEGSGERRGREEERERDDFSETSSSLELPSNAKTKESPGSVGFQESNTGSVTVTDASSRGGMRRVKNINMGEIPLCPVGLSLSGSGMQLFVQMDNFLQKEQLSCLENQFVAKVCKARKADVRKIGRRRKQTSGATLSSKRPNPDDSGVCVRPNDTHLVTVMAAPHSGPKDELYRTASSNVCEVPIVDLVGPDLRPSTMDDYVSHCDTFIKEEILGHESVRSHHCEAVAEDDRDPAPSSRNSPVTRLNATSSNNNNGPNKFLTESDYQGADASKANNVCEHRRDSKRNQSIQTSPALDWAVVRPKAVIPNVVGNQKRSVPPVFTSSDLPLKRPSIVGSCSSADILIYQQRNNSSFFSPIQPTRPSRNHAFGSTNINNASACLSFEPNSEANLSSRNNLSERDDTSLDKINESESSKYDLIDAASPDSLPLTEPPTVPDTSTIFDPDGASTNVQPTHSPDSDRGMEEDATPVCADFDPSHVLASGVVDAETLAKFAEYTRSMRRDLKQNYKRLSVLMKSFNEQVVEHSRHQADMVASGSSDIDRSDDMFSPDRQNRCLLM